MHGGFQRLAELADMAPAQDRRRTTRRLLAYLTERRAPLVWALVFVFLGTAGQALGPLVLQRVTNQLVDAAEATAPLSQRLGELRLSMAMLLGVYVLGLLGFVVQVFLIGTLGQEVLGRMRQQIFDQVQRLSAYRRGHHQSAAAGGG